MIDWPSSTVAASGVAVGVSFCGVTVSVTAATFEVSPAVSSIVYEKLSPVVSDPSCVYVSVPSPLSTRCRWMGPT